MTIDQTANQSSLPVSAVTAPLDAQSSKKSKWRLAAALITVIAIVLFVLLRGRGIRTFFFFYDDINEALLNQLAPGYARFWATPIFAAYVVAAFMLPYSAILRVLYRKRNFRTAFIAFLSLAIWSPWYLLEAKLESEATVVEDSANWPSCFDTKGRPQLSYTEQAGGKLFVYYGTGAKFNASGRELRPITAEVCERAQVLRAGSVGAKENINILDAKESILHDARELDIPEVTLNWVTTSFFSGSIGRKVKIRIESLRSDKPWLIGKDKVNLVGSVCNKGDSGISEGEKIYIWYVPDKENGTVRWTHELSKLATGACEAFVSSTEVESLAVLDKIFGSFYFSAESDKAAIKIHVPKEDREKEKAALTTALPNVANTTIRPPPPIAVPVLPPPPAFPPLPVFPPQGVTPQSSALPPPYSDRCLPGDIFVSRLGRCIPAVPGTQNNCPADYIYITRLSSCFPITMSEKYKLYAGNEFTVSGRQTKVIEMLEGSAIVTDTPYNRAYIISAGDRIEIYGAASFQANTFSRIQIVYE